MEWVSAKDRLPEYGKVVLVCSNYGTVQNETFYRDGCDNEPDWWQNTAENADTVEIKRGDYWMPLPPPPPK